MSSNRLTATQAKKEFFLTADDLRPLPFSRFSGWGAGRYKLYDKDLLKQVALHKHGRDGLIKKRRARKEKELNKKHKELKAREAERAMLAGEAAASGRHENGRSGATSGSTRPRADNKEIKRLRKEIARELRSNCNWGFLRRNNRENGADATIRIIRVEQVEYCKLIGGAKDPDLRTLVKRGAWYTTSVPFLTLFGRDVDEISGNGNNNIGIDPRGDLTVKYCPSSQTLSVTAFVLPCDIYECMYGDELSSLASDDDTDDEENEEDDDEGGQDDVISIGDDDVEDEAAKPSPVASSFSNKSYASKPSSEEPKKTNYSTYSNNYDIDLESDSDDSLPPSSGLVVGTSKPSSYQMASAASGSGAYKKKRGSDALPVVSPWSSKKKKKKKKKAEP